MTDKELYKSTFQALQASEEKRAQVMNLGKGGNNTEKWIGKRFTAIAAAVVLILSLSITALAVSYHSDIVGWFNHVWSSITRSELSDAQVQTITELTENIKQSVVDNGTTVTAESLIAGENSVQILFSVAVPHGALSNNEKYFFEEYSASVSPEPVEPEAAGCAGYSIEFYSVNQTENKVYLMLNYNTSTPNGQSLYSNEYTMLIHLQNFIADSGSGPVVIAKGTWDFKIALDHKNMAKTIHIENATVQGYAVETGKMMNVILHNLKLTSTGISYSYEATDLSYQFKVSAVRKDGTEVSTSGGSGYLSGDGNTWVESYTWIVPISLDELDSISFYQAKIAVNPKK